MKKKLIVLGLLVICLAIAASGTLAYYTSSRQAHNVITTNGVSIELDEKTKLSDETLIEFPEKGIDGIMPGTSASKIVSVKNTGGAEAWIRVKADIRIADPDGRELPLVLTLAGGREIPAVYFEVDAESWIFEDGFYYFREPVEPGRSTEILFDEVNFAWEMGNEYQSSKVLIDIYAQAVQTENNIPASGDVTDVQGWPRV